MGVIYGWLTSETQQPPATSILEKLSSSANKSCAHPVSCLSAASGLGGNGLSNPPAIYKSADMLVIIEGNPVWQDDALATIKKSAGDAHALTAGFKQYGKSVLNKIQGPFSLCIIQPESNYVLLAVDRMGIRPLAYYCTAKLLVFASHLEHIIAHPEVKNEVDPQGIFNYLYFHMIPSPGSIYRNIKKLLPGEYLEYRDGKFHQDFYWQISYSESTKSEKQLAVQLHTELSKSVEACLSEKSTGTFLSGGIDSSTVTGLYQSLAERQIDAFSIGFDAKGYDEMEFARASAKHFGVLLHEYYVTPADVLDSIPLIAAAYDEPFGNASAIPAYYCAKFAKQNGMDCLLAGDGGDEIFAGNAYYAKQQIFDLYRHCPGILKKIIEPLAAHLPPLRKVNSYIEQANLVMPERSETYNFLYRTPLEEIFAADFLTQVNTRDPLNNLESTYSRADSDYLIKKMLFLDAKFTLADNDLRKVNRMCELAGIDVQYPLLQNNLIDFSAQIPVHMLMRRFELRSFFRHAMSDFLAPETLDKSKQGFGLPFGVWMRSDSALKAFAHENLINIEKRGILNPEYIKTIIKAQQEGHASYYGVMIWILIMLEQWLYSHEGG